MKRIGFIGPGVMGEPACRNLARKSGDGGFNSPVVGRRTGHLGGFNFQWAWASGHAAGQVA